MSVTTNKLVDRLLALKDELKAVTGAADPAHLLTILEAVLELHQTVSSSQPMEEAQPAPHAEQASIQPVG